MGIVNLFDEVSVYLQFFIYRMLAVIVDSDPLGHSAYDWLVTHICLGVAVSVFIFICRKIKQLLV